MWDLLFKVVNTAILAGILYKVLKKPFTSFVKSRREIVKTALEEAEQARVEAAELSRRYLEHLTHLEEELEKIRATFIQEGEREKARIIAEAHRAADKIKEQARLLAEQELKMTRLRLNEEIAEESIRAAEALITQHLGPADHERLVHQYIEQLRRLP